MYNIMRVALLSMFSLLMCFAFAQEVEIKGVVTDKANKEPLVGVNIFAEGTSAGYRHRF